jgi:hypothetical protein
LLFLSSDATPRIWLRIPGLRRLTLTTLNDTSHILSTQTGLTWLQLKAFSPHIQYCTNLLELTIPLPSLSNYHYLPSSLTRLGLRLDHAKEDDNFIDMIKPLPRVASLKLEIGMDAKHVAKAGALSSLSRWSSLTKLTIRSGYMIGTPSLEGWFIMVRSDLPFTLFSSCLQQMDPTK